MLNVLIEAFQSFVHGGGKGGRSGRQDFAEADEKRSLVQNPELGRKGSRHEGAADQ